MSKSFRLLIQRWRDEGTISQEQADKMLLDLSTENKAANTRNITGIVLTMGAVLVGLGIILFVASHWLVIPQFVQLIFVVTVMVGCFWGGFHLRFEGTKRPLLGAALIFLSTLLVGAALALVGQIYHIEAGAQSLVLTWLILILPVMYLLGLGSVAFVAGVLFYIWVFLMFKDANVWALAPWLWLALSGVVYGFGLLHTLMRSLETVGRNLMRLGIFFGMIAMFVLSFSWTTGYMHDYSYYRENAPDYILVHLTILAVILNIIGLLTKKAEHENIMMGLMPLAILFIGLGSWFLPAPWVWMIAMNVALLGAVIAMIYVGNNRQDINLINSGLGWFGLLVLARYIDFGASMLEGSAFFIVGGLLMLGCGIALERYSRSLKQKFTAPTI